MGWRACGGVAVAWVRGRRGGGVVGGGVWGRGRGGVACAALRQQWGAVGGVVPQVGHQAAGRGLGAAFGRARWWGVRCWWLLLPAGALRPSLVLRRVVVLALVAAVVVVVVVVVVVAGAGVLVWELLWAWLVVVLCPPS